VGFFVGYEMNAVCPFDASVIVVLQGMNFPERADHDCRYDAIAGSLAGIRQAIKRRSALRASGITSGTAAKVAAEANRHQKQ
jgi:hypothetical protein